MPTPKPPRPADSEDELPKPHLAQPPRYIIYLLTVWFDESSGNDPTNCRFRLENPRTKQGKGFVGVEALMKGLCEVIGERGRDYSSPDRE
jgi:hypothetical protein